MVVAEMTLPKMHVGDDEKVGWWSLSKMGDMVVATVVSCDGRKPVSRIRRTQQEALAAAIKELFAPVVNDEMSEEGALKLASELLEAATLCLPA